MFFFFSSFVVSPKSFTKTFQAKAVDDALASGEDLGPLAGIPFAIKVFVQQLVFVYYSWLLTIRIVSSRRTTFACLLDPLLPVSENSKT